MANDGNVIRQGFLYEDENQILKDTDFQVYEKFIKNFLVYYKVKHKDDPSVIDYNKVKNKIDDIILTFKKRISFKRGGVISTQKKFITTKFPDIDIENSFKNLLEYSLKLNETIVGKFLKNMIKDKEDLDKLLKEAEYGFQGKSVIDFADKIGSYLDNLFTYEDKYLRDTFESKGYFNELYNKWSKIDNPTKEDLDKFKEELIQRIEVVSKDIENEFHEYLNNLSLKKFRIDKIKKFFEGK